MDSILNLEPELFKVQVHFLTLVLEWDVQLPADGNFNILSFNMEKTTSI